MKEKTKQKLQNAICVENVSKEFNIPHERINTLKSAFINIFRKNTYESFYALKDISFEVKKGEFFGIIGRNGSGKSTLLKILAGVYTKDKGTIKINGLVSPFLELGIGFNPELSGRDNIYLNATILGLSEKEIDEKLDSIIAFSELERFIDQKVKNYSSGMQVRLAFSVAIHANREILLMDEVLAVGDSNFQSKCLGEFNRYKEMGKTVILVTHDVGTIQRYCDRAMLLRNGEIVKIGKAEEVGNEYIYQNMSDEEKRIIKEQEQQRIKEKEEIIEAEKEAEKLKGKEKEDEEQRIKEEKIRQEEEIKRQNEERKNKVAEITSVELLNSKGEKKNVFETDDDISVRVYFKQGKKVTRLNFGIAILNQEDSCILGISTVIDDKIDVKKYLNDGYFQVDFKKIPLRGDEYYINAAIFGENHEKIYDFSRKTKSFKIFSKNKNDGIVALDYDWKQ